MDGKILTETWRVKVPALPYALSISIGITLASEFYFVASLLVGALLFFACSSTILGRLVFGCVILLTFCLHQHESKIQLNGRETLDRIAHTSVPISIPAAKVVDVDHRDFGTIATIEVIETEASLKGLQGVFSVGTRFNVIFGKPVELGDEVNLEGATKQARAHNFTEQGFIQTWRDGIAGSLYSREWSFLKQNSRGWLFQKRRQLRGVLISHLLYGIEEDSAAVKVLPAAVLGQKTSDRAWNELFRSSGAMHLFVVSGMHVGFVVLCFWVVMYFTPLSSRGILILSLFLVWFYAWVTGGHPPIFRAALVYSLISLGYLLRLRVHALNAVIVAFIIIVMMNRYALFEVGVWLSFFVVLVLVLFAQVVTKTVVKPTHPDHYLPRELWSSFQVLRVYLANWFVGLPAVSFIAWMASSVITYFVFGEVYLTGVLTTLLLLPAVFLMVMIGGVSMVLGFFSPSLSLPFNHMNERLAIYATTTIERIHDNGRFVIRKESEPFEKGLVIFDLENGGAAIYLGDGADTLIDVGGRKVGSSVLKPSLRASGISAESVIISHSDSQHSGGVESFPYANVIRAYEEPHFKKRLGEWLVESLPIHVPHSSRADDNIALFTFTKGNHTIGYISDAGLAAFNLLEDQALPFSCDLLIVGENSHEENVIHDFIHYTGAKTIVLGRTYSYQAQRELKNVTTYDQRYTGALRIYDQGGQLTVEPILKP